MELPFAVESSDNLQHSTSSSLVTASSQGSLLHSSSEVYEPIVTRPQAHGHTGQVGAANTAAGGRLQNQTHNASKRFPEGSSPTQQPLSNEVETETIDFTFVKVWESDADEVDVIITGALGNPSETVPQRDLLSVLLAAPSDSTLIDLSEQANREVAKAMQAKKDGNLPLALDAHAGAAKLLAQLASHLKGHNASLARSLFLLSQTQAKSALALQRVIKLRPNALPTISTASHKDRLRERVRGALDHPTEADISDSTFLGRAKKDPPSAVPSSQQQLSGNTNKNSPLSTDFGSNPVDEMMQLERELRDMDMTLEMGNSIASLDARQQQQQNRMKNLVVDGSFMVVPPGASAASNSFLSSSSMWSAHPAATRSGSAGTSNNPRARANRVQNLLEASSSHGRTRHPQEGHPPPQGVIPKTSNTGNGLDSSWWGQPGSSASQVLSSSVISLASHAGHDVSNQPANTKQLMRLMDSLKTLGDENATLLRDVEGADKARREARAAKEQMRRFEKMYTEKFSALKAALEKFRKGNEANLVTNSEYLRSAENSDQLQRQEELIRKLTLELKKEKDESKKKDAALRKYESFYREVKARSAQKAAQRQREAHQRQSRPSGNLNTAG